MVRPMSTSTSRTFLHSSTCLASSPAWLQTGEQINRPINRPINRQLRTRERCQTAAAAAAAVAAAAVSMAWASVAGTTGPTGETSFERRTRGREKRALEFQWRVGRVCLSVPLKRGRRHARVQQPPSVDGRAVASWLDQQRAPINRPHVQYQRVVLDRQAEPLAHDVHGPQHVRLVGTSRHASAVNTQKHAIMSASKRTGVNNRSDTGPTSLPNAMLDSTAEDTSLTSVRWTASGNAPATGAAARSGASKGSIQGQSADDKWSTPIGQIVQTVFCCFFCFLGRVPLGGVRSKPGDQRVFPPSHCAV